MAQGGKRPEAAADRLCAKDDVVPVTDRRFHRAAHGAADEHALVDLAEAVRFDPARGLHGLGVAEVTRGGFEGVERQERLERLALYVPVWHKQGSGIAIFVIEE